uniref:RFamide-related peptide n=1 Tax=Gouania willdenowi TaxID=441366 RepID=A0A8C5DZ89_GOUWI
MLRTLALSVLLVLGRLEGAPTSDIQSNEKSIHRDRILQHSRHTMRKKSHQQTIREILRSLDPASFNIHVVPTSSKHNPPTILKLYAPTTLPVHMNVNMPMRFGRISDPGDRGERNTENNFPQRFGRSRGLVRPCLKCIQIRNVSNQGMPQRFGRNSPDWSHVRTLAQEELLDIGLHWPENLDFENNSKERNGTNETFKG